MSIGLVLMVKDEADWIGPTLATAKPLIDHWTITDTGSTDATEEVARIALDGVPGEYRHVGWEGWAHNRTDALAAARDTGDWLLTLDADVIVDAHPDLRTFLVENEHSAVGAWLVELAQENYTWRLPWLVRGGLDWRYVGAAHEYLDDAGRPQRALAGLTLHHRRIHVDRDAQVARLESYLELLAPERGQGARATFYVAEALRYLGREEEAIAVYKERAMISVGWEEEGWFAQFMAAKLAGDIDGLIDAYRRRPWRPEPLREAARLAAAIGHNDTLYVEKADA